MSRNSGGTYTLPAGNPVITGTVISSTWANTTLSDIATALTDSLSRSGKGGMTAQLALSDGTIGAPGLSWGTEPTSGLYRNAAGDFRYSVSAADKFQITTNGIRTSAGTLALPGFSFIADIDTGIYSFAANDMRIVAGGASVARFLPNFFVAQQLALFADGLVGGPGIAFDADPDTGIYRVSANVGGLSAGGVLSFFWDSATVGILDGSTVTPGIRFINDGDTGIYRVGANQAGLVAGGVRSLYWDITHIEILDGTVGTPGIGFQADPDTGFFRASADAFRSTVGGVAATTWFLSGGIAQTLVADGSAAVPGLGFTADADTGIYRVSANRLGVAIGGVQQVDVTSASLELLSGQILASGTALVGAPGFSFGNDADTGIYRLGANYFGASTSGVFAGGWRFVATNPQMISVDGTAGVPGIAFDNDLDTGMYRAGANDMRIVSGGANVARFLPTFFISQQLALFADGAAGGPGLAFDTDTDTGIYRVGADTIGLATGGVLRWSLSTATITATIPRYGANGAVGAPSYAFSNHTNGGLWSPNNSTINISVGGLLVVQTQQSGVNTDIVIGATSSSTMTINNTVSTVAAAGGTAIPTAAGFIHVTINGTLRKIPFCA